MGIIKPAIKHTNFSLHFVISVQAGIQYYQQLFWIPALRYAAAGMTYLIAGLIACVNQEMSAVFKAIEIPENERALSHKRQYFSVVTLFLSSAFYAQINIGIWGM